MSAVTFNHDVQSECNGCGETSHDLYHNSDTCQYCEYDLQHYCIDCYDCFIALEDADMSKCLYKQEDHAMNVIARFIERRYKSM